MDPISYTAPNPPNSQGMPAFFRGVDYARDRRDYENAVSLQDLMKQLGAQRTMATQPGQIAATNAENQAKSMYAVSDAGYKNAGLRLDNEGKVVQNSDAELKLKSEKLKKAMADMDAVIQASAVLSSAGANPAAYQAFTTQLQQSGVDPQLIQFFSQTTGTADLKGRLEHIKRAREQTNIEWAKLRSNEDVARLNATSQSRPGIWEQHVATLTQDYIRQGYSPADAKSMATREAMTAQANVGGVRTPPPVEQGRAALAKAVAELKTRIGIFPEGDPTRTRMEKHLAALEAELSQAERPLPGQNLSERRPNPGPRPNVTGPANFPKTPTPDAQKVKAAVEAAGGTYEPDKYDYRIGPNGVQRRAK